MPNNPTISLEAKIRELRTKRDILITSHAVLGFPSIEENLESVDVLVSAGVEIIELQFPFSEPTADGPFLMLANLKAVDRGTTPQQCFDFASMITKRHPNTIFIIMTYYNILYQYDVERFVKASAVSGVVGLIVPDLPPKESRQYYSIFEKHGVSLIFLVTPLTSTERMKEIATQSRGMLYCVARQGVTGLQSLFTSEFDEYIQRIKSITDLPLGVGFGVQSATDVAHLTNKVDIAIICTHILKISVDDSPKAGGEYAESLRIKSSVISS